MDQEERISVTQAQRDRVRPDENEQSKRMVKEAIFTQAGGQPHFESKSLAETQPRAATQQPLSDGAHIAGEVVPSKAKSLNQLLLYTTVENLLANGGNIISLKEDSSIEDALKTFKETGIQSAPVYDGANKFIRILDVRDIFSYFSTSQQDDLDFFFKQSIKNITVGLTDSTPMIPIGTSLSEVLKTLAAGVHHVGIPDDFSRSLFNIISQLSVLEFIGKNVSLMSEELRSMPVSEFIKQGIKINTIPSDTSTGEAFAYLFKDGISAAAIVDELGRLIDTISTFDLVGVVYDRFEHLKSPVIDYIRATRRTKALKPPITCQLSDTLEYVIIKLASTGVHRLWVVDDKAQEQYLGYVNLTNVLQAICDRVD